jgi:trimethylamine:corrinoid methyltransferase-like protein
MSRPAWKARYGSDYRPGRRRPVHDAGYIEYGLTASMEMTVMNDELIGLGASYFGRHRSQRETMARS